MRTQKEKKREVGREGRRQLLFKLLLQTGPKACLIDTVNLYREVV